MKILSRSEIDKLKCVKCGSREDLTQYRYNQRYLESRTHKHKTTTKTFGYESELVVTCSKCKDEFIKYAPEKREISWPGFYCIFFAFLILLTWYIFMLLTALIISLAKGRLERLLKHGVPGIAMLVLCVLIWIGIVYYILVRKKVFISYFMSNNPKKYFQFWVGKLEVRPKGAKKWIKYNVWINNTLVENGYSPNDFRMPSSETIKPSTISLEYCSRCKSTTVHNIKVDPSTQSKHRFCVKCGKKNRHKF